MVLAVVRTGSSRIAPASATEKPAAIVVFFSSAISVLTSGGTTDAQRLRQDDHADSVWPNVRPSARAASAWPSGTVLMPERTTSQTNAEVYSDQRDDRER